MRCIDMIIKLGLAFVLLFTSVLSAQTQPSEDKPDATIFVLSSSDMQFAKDTVLDTVYAMDSEHLFNVVYSSSKGVEKFHNQLVKPNKIIKDKLAKWLQKVLPTGEVNPAVDHALRAKPTTLVYLAGLRTDASATRLIDEAKKVGAKVNTFAKMSYGKENRERLKKAAQETGGIYHE